MKRIIALFIAFIMLLTLAGCGTKPVGEPASLYQADLTGFNGSEEYQLYVRLLQEYAWVNHCASDLSSIPYEDYPEWWMGEYTVFDIDKDGIGELIILAGEKEEDMSLSFYTVRKSRLTFLGSYFCGNANIYGSNNNTGLMSSCTEGGILKDTLYNFAGEAISRVEQYSYNEERWAQSVAQGDKGWEALALCSVHDASPLFSLKTTAARPEAPVEQPEEIAPQTPEEVEPPLIAEDFTDICTFAYGLPSFTDASELAKKDLLYSIYISAVTNGLYPVCNIDDYATAPSFSFPKDAANELAYLCTGKNISSLDKEFKLGAYIKSPISADDEYFTVHDNNNNFNVYVLDFEQLDNDIYNAYYVIALTGETREDAYEKNVNVATVRRIENGYGFTILSQVKAPEEAYLLGRMLPEGSIRRYSADEIMQILSVWVEAGYTEAEALRLARNEFYANYGVLFKDEKLNEYFYAERGHIFGDPTQEDTGIYEQMNKYEKANIDLIKELEEAVNNG